MYALVRKPSLGYVDSWLWCPKTYIDAESVKKALSLRFVDSYSEQKIRFVYLFKETEHHLLVPRHLWQPGTMPFRVVDCRPREYLETGITSRVKLDHRMVNGALTPTGEDIQQKAMDALLRSPNQSGILQLRCGSGKTVIALDYIARMGGPALVLVDNTNLMEQWRLQAEALLVIPGGLGKIQASVFDWRKGLVLGTYQTMGALVHKLGEEFFRYFKVVVFEEAHHLSAVTFAPSAEAFPGIRLALSATPTREDGTNIIYDNHVGPIIYKDISQVIKPRIVFKWTGLRVSPTSAVYDRNGELHLSKLSVFFGTWLQRMTIILDDVAVATAMGRKILVLCNSVDETINLCSLWTQKNWKSPQGTLYTDIPAPTPFEVGADVHPIGLNTETRAYIEKSLVETEKSLRLHLPPELHQQLESKRAMFQMQLKQDDVHKLVSAELSIRQKKYRSWLTDNLYDAGLMIHKVKPGDRMEYIRTRQVVFGITKYGKEGLDDESLDTVLVSTPFSSRNGAQQLIGRPTRQKAGKRSPLVVFYEDDIGQLIGMCKKLRHHFSHWPVSDNGPLEFEFHGHPHDSHRSRNHPPIFANL